VKVKKMGGAMSVLGYCILLDSGKEKVKRVVISSVLIKSFASSFFFSLLFLQYGFFKGQCFVSISNFTFFVTFVLSLS
jgi:hypothetical protein